MRPLATLSLLALTFSLCASESLWTENFADAKARAAKEGKDLLIDFTGSDWCGWCIKLKDEVFKQEAFKNEAPKHFILVELDYPRKKEQSPEIKKQNEALKAEFGIKGYPTIFLADANGKPYARTGYKPGGPEKYLESLMSLKTQKKESDAALAAAEKASGPEKAKLLFTAAESLKKLGVGDSHTALLKQVVQADPENKSGVTGKANAQLRSTDVLELAKSGKVDEALKTMNDHIANDKPAGEELFTAYSTIARIHMTKRDLENSVKYLELAIPLNPNKEEAERMTKTVEMMKTELSKKK